MRGARVIQSDMNGNASKLNLKGYASAVLEASLHVLLTTARLWRVLTHCTWEKTTVVISRPGSKVGLYALSLRLPLRVDMVGRCAGGSERTRTSSTPTCLFSSFLPREIDPARVPNPQSPEPIGAPDAKLAKLTRIGSRHFRESLKEPLPFSRGLGRIRATNRPFQRTHTPGYASAAPNTP